MAIDYDVLRAALIGYQVELAKTEAAIAGIKAKMGGKKTAAAPAASTSAAASGAPKKRTMSAAARKRIADAQRKRWAAYHKAHAA